MMECVRERGSGRLIDSIPKRGGELFLLIVYPEAEDWSSAGGRAVATGLGLGLIPLWINDLAVLKEPAAGQEQSKDKWASDQAPAARDVGHGCSGRQFGG